MDQRLFWLNCPLPSLLCQAPCGTSCEHLFPCLKAREVSPAAVAGKEGAEPALQHEIELAEQWLPVPTDSTAASGSEMPAFDLKCCYTVPLPLPAM